jgi:hypothetical protein
LLPFEVGHFEFHPWIFEDGGLPPTPSSTWIQIFIKDVEYHVVAPHPAKSSLFVKKEYASHIIISHA